MKKINGNIISMIMILSIVLSGITLPSVGAAGLSTMVVKYFENNTFETVGDITYNHESMVNENYELVSASSTGLSGGGKVLKVTVNDAMPKKNSGWGMIRRKSDWSRDFTNIRDYLDTGVLSFKFKMTNAAYIPYLHGYLATADTDTSSRYYVGVSFSDQYTEADIGQWKVINIPLKEFIYGENRYLTKTGGELDPAKVHGAGVMFPVAQDVAESVVFYYDDIYIRNVAAPTDFKVVDSDNCSATFSWMESVSDIASYEILRDGVVIDEVDAGVLEYTDEGLEGLTTYKYSVRALDSFGAVSNCTVEVSVFTALVGKPNNLSVMSGFSEEVKAELAWEEPAYGEVYKYRIYRDDVLHDEVDANTLTYTDTKDITNNTTYKYYVAAVSENDFESMPSNEVEVYVANICMPTNLSATVSGNEVVLEWDEVTEAVKYKVYCNGNIIGETEDTQFVHQNLEVAKCYTYSVTAINSVNLESIQSEMLLVDVVDADVTENEVVFDDVLNDDFTIGTVGSSRFDMDRTIAAKGTTSLKLTFATGSYAFEGVMISKSMNLLSARTDGGAIGLYVFAEDYEQVQDIKLALICTSDSLGSKTYTTRTYVELSEYVDTYGYWNYIEIPIKDFPEIGTYISGISELTQVFKFNKVTGISIYTNTAQHMIDKSILCDEIRFLTNPNYVVEAPDTSEIKLSVNSASVAVGSNVKINVTNENYDTVLKSAEIIVNYPEDMLVIQNDDNITISEDWKNAGATCAVDDGAVRVSLPETVEGVKLGNNPVNIKFAAKKVGTSTLTLTGTAVEKDTETEITFVQAESAKVKAVEVSKGGGSSSGSGSGGGTGGGRDSATVYPTVNIPVSGGSNDEKPADAFSDISNVLWAKEAINTLAEKGYVSGYLDGEFKPDNNVSREEFIKMLLSAISKNIDETAECTFDDAEDGAWYYKYLANAQKDGISQGFDNKFGVGEFITREDMCAMVLRTVDCYGLSLKKSYDAIVFADDSQISNYAKEAIVRLYETGIVNGVGEGRFEPKTNVTRAMAAKVICGLLSYKN